MKTKVISDVPIDRHRLIGKGRDLLDLSLRDGPASYQLVGGVMAYQGL